MIPPDIQKAAAAVYARLGRGADADEETIGKALMARDELAIGAIDTLRETLMEGLMTDAGLTDADRLSMNHQLEALAAATASIPAKGA